MLESMIVSPTPTRAEVSDVANAIYEGADAVMLSAESAAGAFPVEAVAMMDKIGRSVEADPVYSARIHFTETPAEATTADALSESAAQIVRILSASAMACYTASGSTARRIARERAQVPTLAMTASMKVSRRLGLQWGVHAVHTRDVNNFEEMVGKAKRMVLRHHLAEAGDRVLIMAGVPFRTSGSTNVIHVVKSSATSSTATQTKLEPPLTLTSESNARSGPCRLAVSAAVLAQPTIIQRLSGRFIDNG
jgi:pyruvate kinase